MKAQRIVAPLRPECCVGALAESLLRIREPHRRIAIWERRIPVAMETWLAHGFRAPDVDERCALPLEGSAAPALDALLARAVAETARERSAVYLRWRLDLLDLIALARRIAPQSVRLLLRLQRLEAVGCPLFHVDRVPLRMVCTYVGAGTEWLPESAVDRSMLGTGDNAAVRDWSAVQHLAAGHVAVMKGDSFRGNAGRGLVHRSPPASAEHPRLLVAIDFG
jgi:hypothetical protein